MTLKMTTAQVVETSVTVTNSSFQNYTHPDDHTTQTTDTPGFKPFTMLIKSVVSLISLLLCYWLNKVVNKMMTSIFQVANCFYSIHLQLETLTDNFDKQI